MLLTLLIILFTSIILYKIIIFVLKLNSIEGMENETETESDEYQPYDPNDTLILAKQNAGNIEYLKKRMDDVSGVKNDVDTVKQDIQTIQIQMDSLLQQQSDMAVELSGGEEPIAVDGLDDEEGEEGEDELENTDEIE